ncbi:isoaspartyl peptidase/L-asparaginase-like [Onthophagus taurus]|uniref:isoaspartyl peptidase/L-asparaginase-like n=1 Tax=Onthophagus taurus TaxID=166361 RepID=UPI000C20E4B2|nr:isoaspartyl peptidase/L-asparaginase-like [Onthophagus taurus]
MSQKYSFQILSSYSKKLLKRCRFHSTSKLFAEDKGGQQKPPEIPEKPEEPKKPDQSLKPEPPQLPQPPPLKPKPAPPTKRPKYLIAVHCGFQNNAYEKHIRAAIDAGYKVLEQTGKGLEAVEIVCRKMEDDPVFNCGKGSVLNSIGSVEMEASIMDGETLRSGAVSGLNNIEHPVTLAKMVLQRTPHIVIAGHGANQFATTLGFPRVPPQSLIIEEEKEAYRKNSESYPGFSAVIVLDPNGNLSTAMSSGGMRRKLPGRVGCCANVGTGYYADNRIAAATTTDSQAIMKANCAHEIVYFISKGLSALEAAQKTLLKLQLRMYLKGAAMAVTNGGDVAVTSTQGSFDWAFKRDGEYKFGNTEGFFQYSG